MHDHNIICRFHFIQPRFPVSSLSHTHQDSNKVFFISQSDSGIPSLCWHYPQKHLNDVLYILNSYIYVNTISNLKFLLQDIYTFFASQSIFLFLFQKKGQNEETLVLYLSSHIYRGNEF